MDIHNVSSIIAFFLNPWIIIGFFGQFIFFMRFIVQWIATEKKGQVTIPNMFWYLSILGTLIIIAYSIHIKDVVFIVANILSLAIYGRNLMFVHRKPAVQRVVVETENSDTNLPS